MDLSHINPRHPLAKEVALALRQRCGVLEGESILVAVSGGADSVALLGALVSLAGKSGFDLKISAGHVHHHLRDSPADEDAAFAEHLAGQLNIPFFRRDLQLSGLKGNVEQLARQQRYEALGEMARQWGAQTIATAHHGDDQLETLLMRILRGTSVGGLRGIAWKRSLHSTNRPYGCDENESHLTLIRPMLGVDRQQIHSYLNDIGQTWREDHTNQDLSRMRARLRQDVLPVLKEIRPDAPRRAVALAEHMSQINELLDEQVKASYKVVVQKTSEGGVTIDREKAAQLPQVIVTALLRKIFQEQAVSLDKLTNRTVWPIVKAIQDGQGGRRCFGLAGGVKVTITRDEIAVI